MYEGVSGLDVVCTECLDKAVTALLFIESCESSNQRLNRIIDSLNCTLSDETDTSNNKIMYIMCNEFNSELIFVDKESIPKKVPKVKCSICKDVFQSAGEVKEHTYNEHGLYLCDKCQHTSYNDSVMVEHEISSELYKCASCPVTRCTESSLKEHEDSLHGRYVCKECGKSFKGLDKLLAHEDKHSATNQCPKCGKIYTTKEFFQKHVKLCLLGKVIPHQLRSELNRPYFCQDCGKPYSTPGGLKVHQKFVHGNAKHHVCNQCGKKFTAQSYLKAHLITHTGAKNFKCHICNGNFVTKEALLYHTRRHTGEKPYSCKICGEKFVNSSSRADHIKHKHIGPTLDCELCPRKFVTKNFLRLHMKRHYDPTNKLYIGRNSIPPNMPGQQNMRCPKIDEMIVDSEYTIE